MNKPDSERIDDDLPELGDDFFSRARPTVEVMGEAFMARVRRPGRPKSESPKIEVKIRLDANVVEHLRDTGKGWQTRVNAELSQAVKAGRSPVVLTERTEHLQAIANELTGIYVSWSDGKEAARRHHGF